MTFISRNLQAILQNSLFAIVAIISASMVMTSTAQAKPVPVYYEATLAAPAKDTTNVVKGTIWHCNGDSCKASKSRTKDEYVCAKMVRKIGHVTAFAAGGVAFDEAALAACNGKD